MQTPFNVIALIGPLGPWEIMIILVVALLIFGKRLPEVGRSMGKGIVEFKKGLSGIEDEIDSAAKDKPAPPKQIDAPAESHDVTADAKEEVAAEQKA